MCEPNHSGDYIWIRVPREHVASICDKAPELMEAIFESVANIEEYKDTIVRAAAEYGSDDVEVDDNAPISRIDYGTWVGAWVFVYDKDEDEEGSE